MKSACLVIRHIDKATACEAQHTYWKNSSFSINICWMNKREKVKRSKEIAYRVGVMLISYMYILNLDGIFNLPKKGKISEFYCIGE